MGWMEDPIESIKSLKFRKVFTETIRLGMPMVLLIIIVKGLMAITGCDFSVVISGSMEPGFKRGDMIVFHMSSDHIRAGEIVLFNVDGMGIPIVHRITKVHEKRDTREVDVLTRGDNNSKDDDRFLYAPGQRWLNRQDVKGRAVVLLPYVGWLGIILTEKPMIKFIFYALCVALHFKR